MQRREGKEFTMGKIKPDYEKKSIKVLFDLREN